MIITGAIFDIDGTLLELGKKEMHQELVDALNLVK